MKLRILIVILVVVGLLLLSPLAESPNDIPFEAYATQLAQPTSLSQGLEAEYRILLEIAANQPAAVLPLLDDLAFSESAFAQEARAFAQAIRAAELQASEAYTLTAVGQQFARLGEWELSLEALQGAVELDPEYAEAWAYLAEAQQQLGQDGRAALSRARGLNPLSLAVNLFQALYEQRQGEFSEAERYFQIALQIQPNDPSLYLQLGHNTVLAGNAPEARIYFEQAAALDPDNPAILKTLAAYSLDNEVFLEELGVPSARRALLLAPEDPEALVLMARASYAANRDEAAAESLFERALQIAPNHPGAWLQLGFFYMKVENRERARDSFEAVIARAGKSPEAEIARQVLEDFFP